MTSRMVSQRKVRTMTLNSSFKHYHEAVQVGQFYDWVNGPNIPSSPRFKVLGTFASHYKLSYSHPFRNGHWAGGGPFISVKSTREYGLSASTTVFRPGWGKAYSGSFDCPTHAQWGFNVGDAYTQNAYDDLVAQGAKAWSRLRPDKPDFTAAVSLYELKDPLGTLRAALSGIRKKVMKEQVLRRRKGRSELSKSGQYFLAAEFGWLPLLSDIRNFVKAHEKGQKHLRQLIRDAGRPVRRTAELSNSKSHYLGSTTRYNSGSGANIDPGFVTQCYGPGPTYLTTYYTVNERTWTEGVFRYYLPPGPRDVVWKKKMLRRLMGARVTPDTVYQLLPWSWLADYFSGLGDFIKAVSPGVGDRLAADYCFVMRHSEYIASREANGMYQGSMSSGHYVTATCTSAHTSTRKMRSYGSPFGWGIKQSSLSPKQLAILGALGLSKLP